jgi:hypothetical protein
MSGVRDTEEFVNMSASPRQWEAHSLPIRCLMPIRCLFTKRRVTEEEKDDQSG